MLIKNCLWCNSQSDKLSKVATRSNGVGVIKCVQCGLFMVAEVPDDIERCYDNELYFNHQGENASLGYQDNYEFLSPLSLYWQKSLLAQLIKGKENVSLLEIGCATGCLLELLRDGGLNIKKLKGIDISQYAVKIAREKGLDADNYKIENFHDNDKFDVIFSAETMEHVYNLASFLAGARNNLKEKGMFIFYIPSIREENITKFGNSYKQFTTSLEHLIFFTKGFLQKEMEKFFNRQVYIYEFEMNGDSCIVGLATSDKEKILTFSNIVRLINADSMDNVDDDFSSSDLYDIAIISAKFYNQKISEALFDKIKKSISKSKAYFLNGILKSNQGKLLEAKNSFLEAVKGKSLNMTDLKILYFLERELLKNAESQKTAI